MRSARRLGWVLLIIGGLAALAAVFGPSERWGGMDLGATGGAVLLLTLGIGIWLFAARGNEVFPEHMSVAERRAWIGLFFTVVILLSFARHFWALSLRDGVPTRLDDFFGNHFMQRLLPLIVVWSVISYLIGSRAGGVEADERDLRLRHRADRAGDWAFTLIVINCIVVLALLPASLLTWWLAPIVLANLLIGLLIMKSLVEHVALTIAYRAGRA